MSIGTERRVNLEQSILLAILSLMAEEHRERLSEQPRVKIELLLSNVGLDVETIGRVLRKQPEAVRKAISRAKARPGSPPAALSPESEG